jgi:methionyl-tRNA formyltransferase
MKIVFFGTPEFAVASLDRLVKDGKDIAAVVTMPDKIAGRGHHMIQSDVKKYAVEHGLRVLQPEKLKSEEFLKELREINADLFIVIAFRMLPEAVWTMPKQGTFNLHGSLLPKYRGAAPINRAIMNGEKETGITTFFLKHEIDTGDIIGRRSIEIRDEDNAGTIHDRLMEMGADMVAETVNDIESGSVVSVPQPEGEFIPAPKIFKEDCRIDWSKDAVQIHNQVRGLSPYPSAFTTLVDGNGKELQTKVFETAIVSGMQLQPGAVTIKDRHLYVGTATDAIEIKSLQPAGKKRMETGAFLLGYTVTEAR